MRNLEGNSSIRHTFHGKSIGLIDVKFSWEDKVVEFMSCVY